MRKFLLVLILAAAYGSTASASPIRGDDRVSVLLCKSNDSGFAPPVASFAHFNTLGAGGLADYWWDMSFGTFDMRLAELGGWFTTAKKTSELVAEGSLAVVDDCIAAAKIDPTNPYTVPAGNRVIVVGFPGFGTQTNGHGALVNYDDPVGAMMHEGGHALGSIHSYSNDRSFESIWWSELGEYDDPYDAMSFGNVFGFYSGDSLKLKPPGLSGPSLDALGWLRSSRIVTAGADGSHSQTFTLAPLGHPEIAGPMLLRIPVDADDPLHYLTVEFRVNDRWDQGLPEPTVLIHEIQKVYNTSGVYKGHAPRLMRDLTMADRVPLDKVAMDGLVISSKIVAGGKTAEVKVVTDFPKRCLAGYRWRLITAFDIACVSEADFAATVAESAASESHESSGSSPVLPCLPGYVSRDAVAMPAASFGYPGDKACVTPAARLREINANAAAAQHTNPARLAFGPNACKPGFKWRGVDEWDWVCVDSSTQERTVAENKAAATNRVSLLSKFCKTGFVWREATPTDQVCVPPSSRDAAKKDNRARRDRWISS